MPLYSDLHLHSRYARATSKYLTVLELYKWAKIKGITLLGTGDILHPAWIAEFQEYTTKDEATGFYKLKPEFEKKIKPEIPAIVRDNTVYFVPTVETSHIYKQGDKVRRIHIVLILESLEDAKKLSKSLSRFSKMDSDGRPILGVHLPDMVRIVLEENENNFVFPAHVWTPHFAVFGSKSGFDSIKEAFKDMSKYITTLETGLSSDPAMNRLISKFDKYILISNSDAHSASRIGREANIHFEINNYEHLITTLKTGKDLIGTIEYFPEEGRYHYDGHAKCKVSVTPKKAKLMNNRCPKCGKPLTLGVLHRVYDLADREEPKKELLKRYKPVSLVPLDDILSNIMHVGKTSKRLQNEYMYIISQLGPELDILHTMPLSTIYKHNYLLGCAIEKMRNKDLGIIPGYDGEYGIVKINTEKCEEDLGNLRLPV